MGFIPCPTGTETGICVGIGVYLEGDPKKTGEGLKIPLMVDYHGEVLGSIPQRTLWKSVHNVARKLEDLYHNGCCSLVDDVPPQHFWPTQGPIWTKRPQADRE